MKPTLLIVIAFLQVIPWGMCACQLGLRAKATTSLAKSIPDNGHGKKCCCDSCKSVPAEHSKAEPASPKSPSVPNCPDDCKVLRHEHAVVSAEHEVVIADSTVVTITLDLDDELTSLAFRHVTVTLSPSARYRLSTLQRLTI